jgi:type II secretory pathway pseudopilin PulG
MKANLDVARLIKAKIAFTLVEVLVALVVFSLLVAMLAQVVLLTGQAITVDSEKLESAAQARLVFDRLGADLEARPLRNDLGGVLFTKASGNDNFQFYSAVSGYSASAGSPVRQFSLVSYRISATPPALGQTSDGPLCLERGADSTDWTSNPVVFLSPSTREPGSASPNTLNYDVLAEGVFRLEFCYLLRTGELSISTGGTLNTDYSNVTGFVVAIAILDNRNRSRLSDSQVTSLSNDLNDCVDGSDPLSVWNRQLNPSTFALGIPRSVIQNIRFYQRTFYVQ